MDSQTLAHMREETDKALDRAKRDGYPCFVTFDSKLVDALLIVAEEYWRARDFLLTHGWEVLIDAMGGE